MLLCVPIIKKGVSVREDYFCNLLFYYFMYTYEIYYFIN